MSPPEVAKWGGGEEGGGEKREKGDEGWGWGTHGVGGQGVDGGLTSAMATLVVSGAAVTLRTLLVSPALRPARLVRLPSTWRGGKGSEEERWGLGGS